MYQHLAQIIRDGQAVNYVLGRFWRLDKGTGYYYKKLKSVMKRVITIRLTVT